MFCKQVYLLEFDYDRAIIKVRLFVNRISIELSNDREY